MTEDEMVGWHHQLDKHEFGQALGVGDRQGSLACCSLWGHKESDMTEGLNCTDSRTRFEGSVGIILLENEVYEVLPEMYFSLTQYIRLGSI